MVSLLIGIIYLAFISLGLPDSLLGSAWPVMYEPLGVPISYAGVVTMIIAGGTILSSLMSNRLTNKLGAGLVTALSVLLTALALLGFSISDSFALLCLWAIPYGLGAGAVDAALNNFVALHYSSRHMSWLHCCWGVGAAASPYIMGYALTGGFGWQAGYRWVGMIQIVLTAILFLSLPLWKKKREGGTQAETEPANLSVRQAICIRGVKLVLFSFFGYCALESTAGLWASSYLATFRHMSSEMAAQFASLFYLGITLGRFLCGFIADKMGDKLLIRLGIVITICGTILVGIPTAGSGAALAGLIVIGLGCAPIYPAIIHATPANFGKENSQAIIGIQMAFAYIGSTFMPPLFGAIAGWLSIGLYPVYLLLFAGLMLWMSERLNTMQKRLP